MAALGEDRTVAVADDWLEDEFGPLDVHILRANTREGRREETLKGWLIAAQLAATVAVEISFFLRPFQGPFRARSLSLPIPRAALRSALGYSRCPFGAEMNRLSSND